MSTAVLDNPKNLNLENRTMKGFAMLEIGKVGWIEKKAPIPGPLDAILTPIALSPCTSDIHTVWSGAIGPRNNMILGHEAVGEVVAVGSHVRDFKRGDRVIVPAITPDWGSVAAQSGFPQHSGEMLGGWKFSNYKDGVFGEFFHVNEADANLALLPDNVAPEHAVMLADMVPTGFHGVELAEVSFGDTVAVIGIGPVGLMSVAGCAMRGAARIIAVGSRPNCVEIARQYGAREIVNYKDGDIAEQISELTGGVGVDRVVIAGGDNDTFIQAIKMLKPGGMIGNVNYLGEGDYVKIPRVEWGVGMGHKRISAGLTPGGRAKMEKLAALLQHKRLDTSLLLTHKMTGFENIEKALLLMREKPRDLIKPVVTM